MEIESCEVWQLPTLYRVNNKGDIRVWAISFDGENLISSWGTLEAWKSGRVQTAASPIELNSSGRNLKEQAKLEAEAIWKRKQDLEGFRTEVMEKDIFNCEAMLASEYTEKCIKKGEYPIWVQPKLDGTRCRADQVNSEENVRLISRGNQVIPHLEHIRLELSEFLPFVMNLVKENWPDYQPFVRLDGEIYTNKIDFDKLSGITRTGADKTVHDKDLDYHIFDLDLTFNMEFSERWTFLQYCFDQFTSETDDSKDSGKKDLKHLKLVPCYESNSHEETLEYLQQFESEGYEGLIVRRISGPKSFYLYGRCTAMYKLKNFVYEEFPVVGAHAGSGNQDGCIIWELKTSNGNVFSAVPKLTLDERRSLYDQYLENPKQFKNQLYRVKFQNYTTKGVPRFPTGIGFIYDR